MDKVLDRKYVIIFFMILLAVMLVAYIFNIISSPQAKPRLSPAPSTEKAYFTIRDTAGNVILETGFPVSEKDEYISEKNIHYIITSVKGTNAIARVKSNSVNNVKPNLKKAVLPLNSKGIPVQAPSINSHVVIYHTHSDESYGYSTGITSKPGNGDIYAVGTSLANSLQRSGISVTHSFNRHDPHDINAYHRSRRTALQLLKERPDAAFDVHRDSAPTSAYFTTVNGVNTSRVMIVIGRSNPNLKTNLDYARRVKAMGDTLYPGMMRGIFIGKGDYNQDLYPTALIFEIGTDGMSLDLAQNAATCLGDVIAHVMIQS